jgi:hypothetical protein
MGTGSFPGVKRPGRGADYPPPSSADVENSLLIIIIIIINCNWVFTRWQRLIYMYTVAVKFTSGGPHEKLVVATGVLGTV